MLSLGRVLFRATILAYAALLVAGAWPYHDVPAIGPTAAWASRILARVSIRPGMPVFNAGEPKRVAWKLAALCQRVVGVHAGSEATEETLHSPECPPTGLQIGTDSFEVLIQRIARATNTAELLSQDGRPPNPRSRGMRRYTALGDWFCRAPEAGGSRFARIRLAQRREYQHYDTGERRSGRILTCSWQCDEAPAPRAQCLWLPADADPAGIRGAAS